MEAAQSRKLGARRWQPPSDTNHPSILFDQRTPLTQPCIFKFVLLTIPISYVYSQIFLMCLHMALIHFFFTIGMKRLSHRYNDSDCTILAGPSLTQGRRGSCPGPSYCCGAQSSVSLSMPVFVCFLGCWGEERNYMEGQENVCPGSNKY